MPASNQAVGSIVWLVMFAGLMYFLVIRPQQLQQKKRNEMIGSLHVGDRIVTLGGLVGDITQVRDDALTVKIADRVEVEIMKSGVGFKKEV
ncbi:MAG: preprotein translocase subunit YajC [Bacillota bacterium]|jgi:preprotein translocase subunit YajC|nr:preprotein translocase subunit YajC [Bacillota bacterium]